MASATLIAIVAVTGCARESAGPPAIRIGDASIAESTVGRWAKAMGLGNAVGISLGRLSGTNRQKALDFLISADWLIGEAGARGVGVSDSAVERRLQERIDSVPNGRSEFNREIASTGQTLADVKLEIEAESAAAKLRAMVSGEVRPVTQTDIADYYRRHHAQFRIPDLRRVDLIESIPTRAAAIALGRRIGPGERFAARALHEQVARQTPYEAAHRDNHDLVHVIFTARPGKVAGPVEFINSWVLVVVRKTIPARMKPLAAAAEEISTRLSAQRRRRAISSFLEAFRRKWAAKTDCRPGYVVQKCSQYRGPMAPEGDLLSGPQ